METKNLRTGKSEAIIIIKAAPQVGDRHGETVCCAAIDIYGNWLRLYPINFRALKDDQKFTRWDRVAFRWRLPKSDPRIESRRVEQDSIKIIGKLKKSERQSFLSNLIVDSLKIQRTHRKSLALIRPRIIGFSFTKKNSTQIEKESREFEDVNKQIDMFNTNPDEPYKPCPYDFQYKYEIKDGVRTGICQDWEIQATFFKWSNLYGEKDALEKIVGRFGENLPKKGMLLAMGTHSLYPDTWLINAIIRLDEITQPSLF